MVTNTIDSLGMTPAYAKGMTDEEVNNSQKIQRPIAVPIIDVDKNIKNGELIEKYDNGNPKFKTFVQNHYFDKYIDIFYPNGKLRTHTPLVNCKANGLSKGYTEDGLLRTEIPYKNGAADGMIKVYDKKGRVIEQKLYRAGYPSS